MFKRILVPTDGSAMSGKAVKLAIGLAQTHGAALVALHVFPRLPGAHHGLAAPFLKQLEGGYEEGQRDEARAILGTVAKEAESAGVAAETVVVEAEDVHLTILAVANQRACDLVCMASHSRSELAAIVLGSETHKVLVHSNIPVLVVR